MLKVCGRPPPRVKLTQPFGRALHGFFFGQSAIPECSNACCPGGLSLLPSLPSPESTKHRRLKPVPASPLPQVTAKLDQLAPSSAAAAPAGGAPAPPSDGAQQMDTEEQPGAAAAAGEGAAEDASPFAKRLALFKARGAGAAMLAGRPRWLLSCC